MTILISSMVAWGTQRVVNTQQQKRRLESILTNPATAAVVVAIAGTIRPAMRFVLYLSAVSIEYI